MTPALFHSAAPAALGLALLVLPLTAHAQDAQPSPTPLDQKAYERAVRDARKAAEQEEKTLRSAAESERKAAESALKDREKNTARLMAQEARGQDEGSAQAPALTKDEERIRKAEEKARAEAEKARLKEEERARKQEAKDAEQRRKDEEKAAREAAKAREQEEKERAKALAAGVDRPQPQVDAEPAAIPEAGPVLSPEAGPVLSKDEEKRRKELVKQIEKARDERDRRNQKAEEAERLAAEARATADEAQRQFEALATGLDVEDVAPPPTSAAAEPEQPKKSRFITKADVLEAEAEKEAPVQEEAPDPLRIALDLKNPDLEAREKAAFALATLGPDAQPATRALMAALADPNPAVRVAAAQALGRIGPGASPAIAPLSAALTDPDPAVKNAAQAALLAIRAR